jgi:membrane protease YdiL (CAAX protease family)
VTLLTETTELKKCTACDEEISQYAHFCHHCGTLQSAPDELPLNQKLDKLWEAIAFFGIELTICCLFGFIESFHTIKGEIVTVSLLAVNKTVFIVRNWSKIKPVFTWNSWSFPKLMLYTAIAVLASVTVHYTTQWLNVSIFSGNVYYFPFFQKYRFAALLMVLFVAVLPAVTEEFGFRGFMLRQFLAITDQQQALGITSLLFAFVHLSFLSLFWLIPFAWFLGYVRIKEETIWYGVVMHFCFNLTTCLFELLYIHPYPIPNLP